MKSNLAKLSMFLLPLMWVTEANAAGTFSIDHVSVTIYYDATSIGPLSNIGRLQLASGDVPWDSLDWGLSDDGYGTVVLADDQDSWNAGVFAFFATIPGGATIKGIEVHIELNGAGVTTLSPMTIGLTKTFSPPPIGTTTLSDTWPATDTVLTFGGPTELWGLTWTPAEINSFEFGVNFRVSSSFVPVPAPSLPASSATGLVLLTLILSVVIFFAYRRITANAR